MRHKGKACVNEGIDPERLLIQYLAGTLFTELDAATLNPNYPLTSATNLASMPIHCATRLKIGAMLPGFSAPPI